MRASAIVLRNEVAFKNIVDGIALGMVEWDDVLLEV